MQTLQQQMSMMGQVPTASMKGANSFYDLVASDSISSYKMSKVFQVYNDKQTLSIAGDTIAPGAGLQIAVNLSDVLLHAHDSGLAFEVNYVGGYCPSAHKILEPISMQLGSLDIQVQNGKWYTSQLLSTMEKEAIDDYKLGLGFARDLSLIPSRSGGQIYSNGAAESVAFSNQLGGAVEYVNSLFTHFKRSTSNGTKQVAFIPLQLLMPALADIPGIYLGLGQKLIINARFVQAGECMLPAPSDANATALAYTVTNAHFLACYSILDAPRRDAIMTQNVSPIPIIRNISYQTTASTTGAFQMPVSRGQYVRRILLSLHPKFLAAQCAVDATSDVDFYTNTVTKYKCPLLYHPNFNLDFIQVQVGSQTYTFRQQQLKFLSLPAFGASCPYESPVIKNFRYCLEIDLSRFGDMTDSAGALGNEQNQITVNWQTSDESAIPGTAVNALSTGLNNFYWVLNAEVISFAQCNNGIYGMI